MQRANRRLAIWAIRPWRCEIAGAFFVFNKLPLRWSAVNDDVQKAPDHESDGAACCKKDPRHDLKISHSPQDRSLARFAALFVGN